MANGAQVPPQHIVEQYKSYMSDIANIGTRYTTAHTFYFTIVSALVGALAIKDVKTPLLNYATPTFVVLMLFIAAICFVWWRTLRHYQILFGAKFAVLNKLQKYGLEPIFAWEAKKLKERYDIPQTAKTPSLIRIEAKVPLWLMGIAILFAACALVYLGSKAG